MWKTFLLALLVLSIGYAQTPPPAPVAQFVVISGYEPQLNTDGTPVRPQGYVYYNLYQGLTATTLSMVRGQLYPGQTVAIPAKGGPCFSISAVSYVDPSVGVSSFLPVYTPMESVVAPAVTSGVPTGLGCVTPLANVATYNVTLQVDPW